MLYIFWNVPCDYFQIFEDVMKLSYFSKDWLTLIPFKLLLTEICLPTCWYKPHIQLRNKDGKRILPITTINKYPLEYKYLIITMALLTDWGYSCLYLLDMLHWNKSKYWTKKFDILGRHCENWQIKVNIVGIERELSNWNKYELRCEQMPDNGLSLHYPHFCF